MLRVGDRVLLNGTVYTARDAAHKKIFTLLDTGDTLPFDLKDAVIYYAGPTPGHDDIKIGSCGPTTSSRMDGFAPRLYDLGLAATIGKGERNDTVAEAIIRNSAAYLCAVGGAGALISRHIKDAIEIAFPELGCESVKKLTVEDMPLTVALDCFGGDIFKEGREKYQLA
jgi:fumarate hydratase subunit beta